MNRPTKEQVDHFVERAKSREEAIGDEWIEGGAFEAEIVLAAEVRALREEVECLKVERDGAAKRSQMVFEAKSGIIEELREELKGERRLVASYRRGERGLVASYWNAFDDYDATKAKLARVEALPKFWRTLDVSSTEHLPEEGRWRLDRCADDLEAALRGDP